MYSNFFKTLTKSYLLWGIFNCEFYRKDRAGAGIDFAPTFKLIIEKYYPLKLCKK